MAEDNTPASRALKDPKSSDASSAKVETAQPADSEKPAAEPTAKTDGAQSLDASSVAEPPKSGWTDPVAVNVPGHGFFITISDAEAKEIGSPTRNVRINTGPQMFPRQLLDHWYVKANKVRALK